MAERHPGFGRGGRRGLEKPAVVIISASVRAVFPAAHPQWLDEIDAQAPMHGIDTANEVASFLAQFGHETRGFTRFEESLNYSAARLMQVWPRRFPTEAIARLYEHNPEALANKVYGGRMGNGAPGDGWKYRGRGPQLTGKFNYLKAGLLVGENLLADPDLVLVPKIGVRIACAGWKAIGMDRFDDDDDVREETQAVNGGEIGLQERQDLFNKLLKVMS
jgi:putative chitinase